MNWNTILDFLVNLLDIVVDYYSCLMNLFAYLYKNFSFPLLFLIIVFLFRNEISGLLKRIQQINLQNNSGKINFYFSELKDVGSEFNTELCHMKRQYGEAYDPNLGASSRDTNDEFSYYLSLIYGDRKLKKELDKNGPFKTIENLHNAYFFLTKDKKRINDRPTQVIEKFYYNAMELQKAGGSIYEEQLIYNYHYFIKTSLNLMNKRIDKEQKEHEKNKKNNKNKLTFLINVIKKLRNKK